MGRLHIPTSNTHVQLELYFHEAQAGTSSFLAAGLFEGVSKNPQKLKAQHWQNVDYANMKQHAQQAKTTFYGSKFIVGCKLQNNIIE